MTKEDSALQLDILSSLPQDNTLTVASNLNQNSADSFTPHQLIRETPASARDGHFARQVPAAPRKELTCQIFSQISWVVFACAVVVFGVINIAFCSPYFLWPDEPSFLVLAAEKNGVISKAPVKLVAQSIFWVGIANVFGSFIIRQRLIALVFASSMTVLPKNIYTKGILYIQVIWLVPVIVFYVSYLTSEHSSIISLVTLFVTETCTAGAFIYYTFKCRRVQLLYSDWQNNARILILAVVVTVGTYWFAVLTQDGNSFLFEQGGIRLDFMFFADCFLNEIFILDLYVCLVAIWLGYTPALISRIGIATHMQTIAEDRMTRMTAMSMENAVAHTVAVLNAQQELTAGMVRKEDQEKNNYVDVHHTGAESLSTPGNLSASTSRGVLL
ncbi:hypothetical protein SARC_05326 [Sphaeroforma arctica JP610]|uniref:Uncharacterized protein n=1 Tax=Sphaeroforma arctica JP610 TaxID=667725 RepID=A0A0L0G0L5_9EUKA|nr:hypothetical protein SARC_05326 [Sphaeroforma arctica JP610]KNC82399.1 hypothetical protein SARC_05326 [Sphaeroforma arctica JP610]|eukprot:XP_014156301.1 hypothetical protein SARC_05326 [Sphaeroforma arctica JP610]